MPIEENNETVVPTKQGDVGLLRELIAQQLLQSKSPLHLAYTWRDGTPRVVPIGFHWNGQEIVLATATDAPKTKVLKNGSKVAVSIDHNSSPPKILLIRGTVRTDTVEGLAPEYVAMIHRTMSEEDGQALLTGATHLYPRMTRIFIHPDWVGILDFETRLPSAVERAIKRA
jgi:Pyridoxamine 5'-phosphate oxidase